MSSQNSSTILEVKHPEKFDSKCFKLCTFTMSTLCKKIKAWKVKSHGNTDSLSQVTKKIGKDGIQWNIYI